MANTSTNEKKKEKNLPYVTREKLLHQKIMTFLIKKLQGQKKKKTLNIWHR